MEEAHGRSYCFTGNYLSISLSPDLEVGNSQTASLLEASGSTRPRVLKPRRRRPQTHPTASSGSPSAPRPPAASVSPSAPKLTPSSGPTSASSRCQPTPPASRGLPPLPPTSFGLFEPPVMKGLGQSHGWPIALRGPHYSY